MTEPTQLEIRPEAPRADPVSHAAEAGAKSPSAGPPDLHAFLNRDRDPGAREAPRRTRELAASLFAELDRAGAASGLAERIVTDALLRHEADRDQNVYLGALFTRTLTHAVPDVIFLPASAAEAATALRWSRANSVPITLRGAASTAMGGSVPNDAGLTLDLSRLDGIEIDAADRVCVLGAGARLRTVHERLAERGLALSAYPSNLGGTFGGWFLTGGIGLNAFARGRALDQVRAADLLLPGGEHVRFHDDGRLDVPHDGAQRRTLGAAESALWFRDHGYEPLTLADLAGSEGVFGILLHLTVAIEPRPEFGAFLLSFTSRDAALAATAWVTEYAGPSGARPANVKLLSGSHLHHVRRVWRDEDAKEWKHEPGALSSGARLPWTRIAGPADLGLAGVTQVDEHAAAHLYVDFLDLAAARAFAAALGDCPGEPRCDHDESVRFAAERFRPQQTKRLGPGLLAAEIVMPAAEVRHFLPRAEKLAANVGSELDAEVYYLADGEALVIGAYLTDHRNGSFAVDLMIAPALLDLAIMQHRGRPYVLGRWQAAWFGTRFGDDAERVRAAKRALDPGALVNRGVLVELRLRGFLGAVVAATFAPGVRWLRGVYGSGLLGGGVRLARTLLKAFPGPARGRGGALEIGHTHRATRPDLAEGLNGDAARVAAAAQGAEDHALHCVNCGECNSVCPIFHDSRIRLPQMLTHLGESMRAGEAMPASGSALLDLCMRCGNCEEVCQAGIPHLPMYENLQRASDHERPRERERHAAIVSAVRGSARYTRDFLHVRPGGYLKRAPVALPGMARFLVLRAENDAGPAATCIHCGACVAVCPTHANREFEGLDARWITTEQERCIGCGSCVEVCPANEANGGQTLRVMEAPTGNWFVAIEEFERRESR